MIDLVCKALKDKNPALHKQLADSGKLTEFVSNLAEQINEQIVTLAVEIANKNGMSRKPERSLLDKAGILKQAESLATEIVLAEMLDFPQDEASPQRPDETTPLATTT